MLMFRLMKLSRLQCLIYACNDDMGIFHFLNELMQVIFSIYIHMDSQRTVYMTNNLASNLARNSNASTSNHRIRDFVHKDVINMECIRTVHDNADIITKPLQRLNHGYFINVLMHNQEMCRREVH